MATFSLPVTLSAREADVFARIGRGESTRQIAEELRLSRKTIETHKDHIKTKLGLKKACELSAYAGRALGYKLGLETAEWLAQQKRGA